ncbi:MAG TPA: hypothetical protein VMH28_02145 [Candidatus Acidoferrales bacterium]|nr:hypothetical protein [Candidatus Acidoferrales bacterium]
MRPRLFAAAALLAALCGHAPAQPKDTRTLAQKLEGFDVAKVKGIAPAALPDILNEIDPDQHPLAFVYYALPPASVTSAFKDFLKTILSARVDQQVGANPSSGGGSNTVAKAGLTSLMSVAVEAGALTETVDQNVTTIHANGDGLFRFLTNQEVIPICPGNDPSCQPSWAKNLDLSASFDVSGSGTQTLTGQTANSNTPVDLTATVTKNRFSSATAQYAVLNQRDLRSKPYHDSFIKWFKQNITQLRAVSLPLMKSFDALMNPVQTGTSPFYPTWRPAAAKAVSAALEPAARATDPQSVEKAIAQQLDLLIAKMRETDPQFDAKLQALFQAYTRYFAAQDQLGRNMITPPQLLIQGTYSEPALQPKLINARFSYAWSPGTPKDSAQCAADLSLSQNQSCSNPGTLTINAGADIYQTPQPTGVGANTARFRDAQVALQFDRPLGSATSPAQLSIGAYYQYQRYPSIFMVPPGSTTVPNTSIPLPPNGATVLTNSKGSLFLAQAMLTIQIPTAGIKVPIGISWSNRTDLVTGNEVRAHIGITFNAEGPMLSAR